MYMYKIKTNKLESIYVSFNDLINEKFYYPMVKRIISISPHNVLCIVFAEMYQSHYKSANARAWSVMDYLQLYKKSVKLMISPERKNKQKRHLISRSNNKQHINHTETIS